MSDFKFAPGLPGYGTQGDPGDDGLVGLSIYFTMYSGTDSQATILTKIANNETLFDSSDKIPGYPDRVYQIGDIIVDKDADVWEIITITPSPVIEYTGSKFSSSGIFTRVTAQNEYGHERYSNIYGSSNAVLTDMVYTNEPTPDYWISPSTIYGIKPENYGMIKYCDVTIPDASGNIYNPFTVYTSGISDNESIAIARGVSNNEFRIGNLDNAGNVRATKLIFDAASVRVSRDTGVTFEHNTEPGTIVTNFDFDTNSLLTPNFLYNPTSFTYEASTNNVLISWDKSDFLNTSDANILNNVKGDLHICEKVSPINGETFDLSQARIDGTYRPIILPNIENTGSVEISGLTVGIIYDAFINFTTINGWSRRSVVIQTTPENIGDPPLLELLNTSITEVPAAGQVVQFDVSGNVDWNITTNFTAGMDFTILPLSATVGGVPTSTQVTVTINENTAETAKLLEMDINSSAPLLEYDINQLSASATEATVTFTLSSEALSGPLGYLSGNVVLRDNLSTPLETKIIDGETITIKSFAPVATDASYNINFPMTAVDKFDSPIPVTGHFWRLQGDTLWNEAETTETFDLTEATHYELKATTGSEAAPTYTISWDVSALGSSTDIQGNVVLSVDSSVLESMLVFSGDTHTTGFFEPVEADTGYTIDLSDLEIYVGGWQIPATVEWSWDSDSGPFTPGTTVTSFDIVDQGRTLYVQLNDNI